MATTIRLARHGSKKHPFYRIIVTDSRAPRDGRRLDQIGTYDPAQQPARVIIAPEKLAHWLRRGARPSVTVAQLIKRSGLASVASPTAAAPEAGETQA
jgi:small subunit ribosomal protein S16